MSVCVGCWHDFGFCLNQWAKYHELQILVFQLDNVHIYWLYGAVLKLFEFECSLNFKQRINTTKVDSYVTRKSQRIMNVQKASRHYTAQQLEWAGWILMLLQSFVFWCTKQNTFFLCSVAIIFLSFAFTTANIYKRQTIHGIVVFYLYILYFKS